MSSSLSLSSHQHHGQQEHPAFPPSSALAPSRPHPPPQQATTSSSSSAQPQSTSDSNSSSTTPSTPSTPSNINSTAIRPTPAPLQLSMAVSPPTPAPSPRPGEANELAFAQIAGRTMTNDANVDSLLATFSHLAPSVRLAFLTSLLPLMTTQELLVISQHISPRLKRDFLRDLPLELALHVLSFVDLPRTLARASCVSRTWRRLLEDEWTWKEMCARHRFGGGGTGLNLGSASMLVVQPSHDERQGSTGVFHDDRHHLYHHPSSAGGGSPTQAIGMGLGPIPPQVTEATAMTFGTSEQPPAPSPPPPSTSATAIPGASGSSSSFVSRSISAQPGSVLPRPQALSTLLPARSRVSFTENGTPSTSHVDSSSEAGSLGSSSLKVMRQRVAALQAARQSSSIGSGGASSSILTFPHASSLSDDDDDSYDEDDNGGEDSNHPIESFDGDDDNDEEMEDVVVAASDVPMTDLTLPQPSTIAPGAAPAGFLSTVPFSAADEAVRRLPRGITSGNGRSQSTPEIGKVAKNQGKGKGKARMTPLYDDGDKEMSEMRKREDGEDGEEDDEEATRSHFSYKRHFKRAYLTESNWLRGGRLLSTHTSTDDGVVTSLAVDDSHIVIGMANCKIHIFEADSGTFLRTLIGHDLGGVWCLTLVSSGGERKAPPGPNDEDPDADSLMEDHEVEAHRRRFYVSGADGSRRRSSTDGGFGRFSEVGNAGTLSSTAVAASFNGLPARSASTFTAGNGSTASLPSSFAHISDVPGLGGLAGAGSGGAEAGGHAGRRLKQTQSDVCGAAKGWGQEGAVIVSGGCDRDVRVWDVETGVCKHTLRGHTSTIRCLKVLEGRPIAVSGSRDWTLRVWDVEKGELVHLLSGHQHSVRCIEIAGNKVVSGSYDCTCRLWDVDTGECLQVFQGHYHQIYAVAFDGERVATGSLDSTVRVWSAQTGECLALLQGHTSLVGQLQLTNDILVTGGSDGRVIIFSLATFECLHRLCAHDNSVTCLQFDSRFVVSGGNDGRVKLWDLRTGAFIRELSRPCEAVWRVTFKDDKCVVLCKRGGKTIMEVLTFRPSEEDL